MTAGDHRPAPGADSAAMLALWERGAGEGGVGRALALLSAAKCGSAEELAALPIGRRDASLLDFHDRLFGSRIECISACAACGTAMEVVFDSADLRTVSAPGPVTMTAEALGFSVSARLPDSRDLAAIEGMADPDAAWESLVRRCVLEARRGGETVSAAALPRAALEAVDAAAAEADPQADLVIGLACPDCGAEAAVPFDIGQQAWTRLDHWARRMLRAVDTIAGRYGWSEAEILALGPGRRQIYLDLIGGVAS